MKKEEEGSGKVSITEGKADPATRNDQTIISQSEQVAIT